MAPAPMPPMAAMAMGPPRNMPTMVRPPQPPAQSVPQPSRLLPWVLVALFLGAVAAAAVVYFLGGFA
jgi:hypothetical protein